MDFRTIQLERVQFDSPNKSRATWKSVVRYGSEKRIVFQTPPLSVNVLQHKFLPDAITLQKASTVDDLQPFAEFLEGIVMTFDDFMGYQRTHSQTMARGHIDYLTVTGDTVVYGETDTLQPGDACKVACLIALTGGWCKPGENGDIVSRGLTFEVDEVKVYEFKRVERAPRIYIDGKPID